MIALTLIASVGIMLYLVKIRGVAHAVNVSRDEYPILGVDLSSHNGDIDFNRLKADSVDFVMLKATEGTTFKDPKFNRNYTEARKAGISHIGAYHFFRFDTDGEMQAMNLINSLRGKTIDLPVAIDLEEWTNPKHLDTDEVVTRLQAMIDYLEINGLTILFIPIRTDTNDLSATVLTTIPCGYAHSPTRHSATTTTTGPYGNTATGDGPKPATPKSTSTHSTATASNGFNG